VTTRPKGVAIIGCGYVADYYASTLPGHDVLSVVGVADIEPVHASRYATHHGFAQFGSVAEALGDERVDIVVNLTNPRSHYDVTKAALLAGKHVYSEKPLAMDLELATELVELAESRGLLLSSAPCSLLGESAQTMWRALRDNRVGRVRVVYAEMDEGLVHLMPFRSWRSAAGAAWPYRDEFEVGTVIEHAGYVVTWLPAFFGPVTSVSGLSECLIDLKAGIATTGTDFSVAVVRFASGVVARVTCTLIAPHDHSLTIVGDEGVLAIGDTWYYGAPVTLRRSINVRGRHQWLPRRKLRLLGTPRSYRYRGTQQMDFARGVADLAAAADEGRSPRLSARYCLHTAELVLAFDRALRTSSTYTMTTTCDPVDPMPWALK
jgi:predicted dehydrogenase